jgi:ABC-type Co2+ transport system permease subunit
VGSRVQPHTANALGSLGDAIARHIPEIDRFAEALGRNSGRAVDMAVPIIRAFIAGVQGIGTALQPVIGLIRDVTAHLHLFRSMVRNAEGTTETIGRVLAVMAAGFVALRVAQTACNVVMAVTDALATEHSVPNTRIY